MAKANVAPTNRAGERMGRLTCKKTRTGLAPNIAAACLKLGFIDLITGSKLLITNGYATKEWAITMISQEARRSSGGLFMVMIKPKPRVTAEIPSGNIRKESNPFIPFMFDLDKKCADMVPITIDINTVAIANRAEFQIIVSGDK